MFLAPLTTVLAKLPFVLAAKLPPVQRTPKPETSETALPLCAQSLISIANVFGFKIVSEPPSLTSFKETALNTQ